MPRNILDGGQSGTAHPGQLGGACRLVFGRPFHAIDDLEPVSAFGGLKFQPKLLQRAEDPGIGMVIHRRVLRGAAVAEAGRSLFGRIDKLETKQGTYFSGPSRTARGGRGSLCGRYCRLNISERKGRNLVVDTEAMSIDGFCNTVLMFLDRPATLSATADYSSPPKRSTSP